MKSLKIVIQDINIKHKKDEFDKQVLHIYSVKKYKSNISHILSFMLGWEFSLR